MHDYFNSSRRMRRVILPVRLLLLVVTTLLIDVSTPAQASHPAIKYFPEAVLERKPQHLLRDWYSTQLRALQEPSVYENSKSSSAESYRFLWLRSFHHPVALRIDIYPDGTGLIVTKVGSGAGGYNPGTLSENRSETLARGDVSVFLLKVKKGEFWTTPNPIEEETGEDGSQWIIEGTKNGRYHVVDRWSPSSGVVRQLGLMLAFDLAKLKVPRNEMY